MLSISGAILRLSWFISNSYSKSEIARSPLTIALAPCSRAKSTSRLSKGFTCTCGYSDTCSWMNAVRSSALNNVFCLRTGWLTTPTITLSNTLAARPMISRCPIVTGSYDPGQTAVPQLRSALMDRDAGIAVAALHDQRERQLERVALVRFGHDACVFCGEPGQPLGERSGQTGRNIIWRVAEHEVEAALRAPQPAHRVGALHARLDLQRLQVALDRGDRLRVALHEHRARRAARQRLDPARARAGVQVEHPGAGHVAQHREERLAHAVRRRSRARAARRGQAAPLELAGDDPHRGSSPNASRARS